MKSAGPNMVLFFAIILLIHYVHASAQRYDDRTSVYNSNNNNNSPVEARENDDYDLLRLNNIFLEDQQYVQMLNDLHNPAPRRFRRDTKFQATTNGGNQTVTRHKSGSKIKNSKISGPDAVPVTTPTPSTRKQQQATTRKAYKITSSYGVNSTTTRRPTTMAMKAKATTVVINNGNKSKVKPSVTPTKYHYYPHNQHIYFLPECAIQQVCNAVYVRLNYTQPLCACPPRYRDPCSASLNEDDNHTIKLVGNQKRKAFTLAKTCESTNELRECRAPKDWSILALQNTRTGKSHYLVICKCPSNFRLEGPLAHDQPTYAGLPGINVYGMLCVPPESKSSKPSNIFNKWNDNSRPVITSSYRSKNSTVLAT